MKRSNKIGFAFYWVAATCWLIFHPDIAMNPFTAVVVPPVVFPFVYVIARLT